MSSLEIAPRPALEDAAASAIGRVVLALSGLEFNLGLYLRNAVGGTDPEAANPLVGRLSFKSKLDALREVVEHKFAAQPAAPQELASWLKAMEVFRPQRNSFVHGRWAFLAQSQQIVNVAPGLPNGKPGRETRYSASELHLVLEEAERLAAEFSAWSRKWPL
jgi:hypothetical protein